MNIDLRRVNNTPYKLVTFDSRVIGIIERKDNKDTYISSKGFTAAQKKITDLIHAHTLVERLENAKI